MVEPNCWCCGTWGLRGTNRRNSNVGMSFREKLEIWHNLETINTENIVANTCRLLLMLVRLTQLVPITEKILDWFWKRIQSIGAHISYVRFFQQNFMETEVHFQVGSFYSKCIRSCHTIVTFNRWLARITQDHDKLDIPSSKVSWKDKEIHHLHKSFDHQCKAPWLSILTIDYTITNVMYDDIRHKRDGEYEYRILFASLYGRRIRYLPYHGDIR